MLQTLVFKNFLGENLTIQSYNSTREFQIVILLKMKSLNGVAKLNKKVIFDEDGEALSAEEIKSKKTEKYNKVFPGTQKSKQTEEEKDDQKWFEVHAEFDTNSEVLDLKERELIELRNLCKNSFDSEFASFKAKNPSDSKWLETALRTGTSKDRVNSGALLVTSNPLGNLQNLETLIGFTKLSNKTSPDVISMLTDLFMEVLLPSHRKLLPIALRGADWKRLQKNAEISSETKRKVYASWHFESELKEQYFEFLKNIQHSMQTGQDQNKNAAIIAASRLLSFSPEKEQMLLPMLINKLGDPSNKVASKALHHLSEVAYKHPNMCGVITIEAEKMLFRNNVSEKAQHFALCFLAQIAPAGRQDVCTKLVNICFAFFKILVKKGAVNNKTMQAILRCLQKAIADAKPPEGSTNIMTKDMEDTIYRLVHLADIRVSIQTLSLLLQVVTVKSENHDRFYNALYRKLVDLNLTTIGTKTASQFMHIIHRAIHIDRNIPRAKAFVKRLLQLALYMPSNMVCGTLIVVNKLFKLRPELTRTDSREELPVSVPENILAKFDSDGEEKYEDVQSDSENCPQLKETVKTEENDTKKASSRPLNYLKAYKDDHKRVTDIGATKYDPYHRIPAFAGAEFTINWELHILKDHFHPTVKVFAESIINGKKIDYYGDPLKDFSITHFLERFAFKNPKNLDGKKEGEAKPTQMLHSKAYVPHGARGKPVSSLTSVNCTEDERFIFNYLEKKRKTQIVKDEDEDNDEVDDDEFDAYLDGLCKTPKSKDDESSDEESLDYLKELGGELNASEKKKKQKKKTKSEDEDDDEELNEMDDDWGDEGSNAESEEELDEDFDDALQSDEEGSVSLDEDNDEDVEMSGSDDDLSEDNDDDDEENDSEPQPKRIKKTSFGKTLKNSDDVSSLFAAADDFAELLEETGKTKGHGTMGSVFNKDKSSEKQLKWEEKRRGTLGKKSGFRNKSRKFTGKKNNRK